MKATKLILAITLLFASAISYGQNQEKDSIIGKEDYYKERAKEDAKFEQEFNSKSKSEDKSFWKDQRAYEKELKKKDEVAHEAYMQGKKTHMQNTTTIVMRVAITEPIISFM